MICSRLHQSKDQAHKRPLCGIGPRARSISSLALRNISFIKSAKAEMPHITYQKPISQYEPRLQYLKYNISGYFTPRHIFTKALADMQRLFSENEHESTHS